VTATVVVPTDFFTIGTEYPEDFTSDLVKESVETDDDL
jgi:hypothetical protein